MIDKLKVLLWILILAVAIGMLEGCSTAPVSENEQFERDERELLRLEKFERDRLDCESRGGMIQIRRHEWVPRYCTYRACPPSPSDRVECVRR